MKFLEVGLIFNKSDVDEEKHIKENAKPLDGVVRCYTGDITSYLNGEKSNTDGYYGYGKQGFVDYDELVLSTKKNGLSFIGPKSFEEFKEKIISGEQFPISLQANLTEEKENELEREVEKPRKLTKKTFFRRK